MDKHLISNFRFNDYKISYANLTINEDYDEKNVVNNESLEVSVGINIKLNDSINEAIV